MTFPPVCAILVTRVRIWHATLVILVPTNPLLGRMNAPIVQTLPPLVPWRMQAMQTHADLHTLEEPVDMGEGHEC